VSWSNSAWIKLLKLSKVKAPDHFQRGIMATRAWWLLLAASTAAAAPPNILIILTDDQG